MTALEILTNDREKIRNSLGTIILPKDAETRILWAVGATFNVTGQTVKNYLSGNIGDYLLGAAIFKEFKRLKCIKK